MINDVRELNIAKTFKSFEKLAHEANTFAARLRLMGKEGDVENTYILQEIEGKLNQEDKQRWLESTGEGIDGRTVSDLCDWLEKQTHLRRLIVDDKRDNTRSGIKRNYDSHHLL